MRRGLLLALLLLAATLPAACGGDPSPRDRVRNYIESANDVQVSAAPNLQRANRAYRQFARGRLPSAAAMAELARAEDAIRALTERLADLDPPREATKLHELMMRVLDLNADLATESTQLSIYLPQARAALVDVGPVNERLRRRLEREDTPGGQTAALQAYRRALAQVVARLEKLTAPPILAATHAAQLERLSTARALAGELRTAVANRDSGRVGRLLLRFRRVNSGADGDRALTNAEIRSYDQRYSLVERAASELRREELRLQRALG